MGRMRQSATFGASAAPPDCQHRDTAEAMNRDETRFFWTESTVVVSAWVGSLLECTRLDVLRASGAEEAAAIAVCIDQRAATSKIVELAKAEFPRAQVLARAFDREHAVELLERGADYQVRETFESALLFGRTALEKLGFSEEEAAETYAEVRRRDAERFDLDLAAGVGAGSKLLIGNVAPRPQPFVTPQRKGSALNAETALITGEAAPDGSV